MQLLLTRVSLHEVISKVRSGPFPRSLFFKGDQPQKSGMFKLSSFVDGDQFVDVVRNLHSFA